ncbi:hypothetical protein STEG23_003792, partial [Scotinomys teguina]
IYGRSILYLVTMPEVQAIDMEPQAITAREPGGGCKESSAFSKRERARMLEPMESFSIKSSMLKFLRELFDDSVYRHVPLIFLSEVISETRLMSCSSQHLEPQTTASVNDFPSKTAFDSDMTKSVVGNLKLSKNILNLNHLLVENAGFCSPAH